MDTQSPQEKDRHKEYLVYICDRTQKVTQAVYRVTDLLSDKEPLKWEIREKAVAVFNNLISVQDKHLLEKRACFEEIEKLIVQLIIIFSLLSESKTISSANFEILKEEYNAVKKIISSEKQKQDYVKLFLGSSIRLPQSPIGQKSIGQSNGQKQWVNKNKKANKGRKDKILNIIKDKKEVTMGELAAIFTEYSEKTIQRDLLEMVHKGLLKKQGEKRWRKYMLVASNQ
jgi:hypothetical protein